MSYPSEEWDESFDIDKSEYEPIPSDFAKLFLGADNE